MCLRALVRFSCFSGTPTAGTCVVKTNKNDHISLLVHQTGGRLEGVARVILLVHCWLLKYVICVTFLMSTSKHNGQSGRALGILLLKWTLEQEQRGMDVMRQEVQRSDDWSGEHLLQRAPLSASSCQKETIEIKPSIKPLINGRIFSWCRFRVLIHCRSALEIISGSSAASIDAMLVGSIMLKEIHFITVNKDFHNGRKTVNHKLIAAITLRPLL